MKTPTIPIILAIGALMASCGNDCTPIEQELIEKSTELEQRDSTIGYIGETFLAIDSNLANMRSLETELMLQLREPKQDRERIIANVNLMQSMMAQNDDYMQKLLASMAEGGEVSQSLLVIIESMDRKIKASNLSLARLNHDLGTMGDDFKDMFSEYLEAEVDRMVLQENLQQMQGEMSGMKAQVDELQNYLNTAYVAIGTKRELINKGVLERGGILKKDDVNEDFDRMAFKPYDIRSLESIEIGTSKAEIVTEHPTESYKIENGVLIIEAPKTFWSISKYLIVVVD